MPQYTYSLIPYMSFLGIVIYFVFCHWIQGYLHICVIGPIYHRYKKIVTHDFPRSNTLRQLGLYYKSCHPLQGPCNHNYRTCGTIKVLERISTHTASVICAIYFERTIHYYSRSSTVLPLFSKNLFCVNSWWKVNKQVLSLDWVLVTDKRIFFHPSLV